MLHYFMFVKPCITGEIHMKIKMENEFMLSSPDTEQATSPALVYLPAILDAWRKIMATPGDLADVLVAAAGAGLLSSAFGAWNPIQYDSASYSNTEPPAE
jgi:hypothetical protein